MESSAVLSGSVLEEDFPYPSAWKSEGNPLFLHNGIRPILVRANHQHRTGIFGSGTIDGGALPGYIQGSNASLDKFEPKRFRQASSVEPICQGECRPQLVLLEDCQRIDVQDVTLQNSPEARVAILLGKLYNMNSPPRISDPQIWNPSLSPSLERSSVGDIYGTTSLTFASSQDPSI